jgi:putative protease
MIELTLPAGSMQAALAAFDGGADGIYLGLTEFSARKGAQNFTIDELSALRRYAIEHDKRIYVTINTLVDETALLSAWALLNHLAFIGCDGVIVQDLGLAHLIRTCLPTLALHASTQMTVHTAAGVGELVRLGFQRIVLARELTVEEIALIRTRYPDVELKVFIHGALCYSVSGVCMASHQVCGRSANEGACAQICRNYFTVQQDTTVPSALSPMGPGAKTAWFFSMSDLDIGEKIRRLAELGVESVKVEGRMKGPAYTRATARYYRALLDGISESDRLGREASVAFSRRHTEGWLFGYGRTKQDFSVRTTPTFGSTSYPGHQGIRVGRIVAVTGQHIDVLLKSPLALRDGVSYFIRGRANLPEAYPISVSALYDVHNRAITHAGAGERVTLPLPQGSALPNRGEHLFLISLHDQLPPQFSEPRAPMQRAIDTTIEITEEGLTISGWDQRVEYALVPSEAHTVQPVQQNLIDVFSRSGDSLFCLNELTVINRTHSDIEHLFLPLSSLNEIRRSWYEHLDRSLARTLSVPLPVFPDATIADTPLPPRSLLTTEDGLPFCSLKTLVAAGNAIADHLFFWEGTFYLPLPPVSFDEDRFAQQLAQIVTVLKQENLFDRVRFGLNNIGHIALARKFGLTSFFDIYLYLSNSVSAHLALSLEIPLVGGYLWMERSETEKERWPFTPQPVDPAFRAPAFISRSCFRKDSLLLSCEGCPHKGSWYATADTVEYRVLVDDCITTVLVDQVRS